MKTLTLSLSLLLTNVYAQENIKWATGPFWRAPQVTEMSVALKSEDTGLVENCENYRKIIGAYANDEVTEVLARKIERMRKMPNLAMQSSFKTRFVLAGSAFNYLLEEEMDVKEVISGKTLDILPMYNQSRAITGVNLKNLSGLKVKADETSFTAFSRTLGLSDSTASLLFDREGRAVLEVDGRDLACDLLAKRAGFESKISSYVKLPDEKGKEIVNFYNFKIAPAVEKILVRDSDSQMIKSAKLGFRLGQVLEERERDGNAELVEKQLVNMMKLLFVPNTLNPASLLVEVNGKKAIDVYSMVDGEPVTLTLRNF